MHTLDTTAEVMFVSPSPGYTGRVAGGAESRNRRNVRAGVPGLPIELSSGLSLSLALMLLVGLLAIANAASAITVRVGAGSDPACGAVSIQGAVGQIPAGVGAHRILLSNNQTYQAAGLIENRNVSIEGGYANCSAAAAVAGVRTAIGPSPAATTPLLTMRRSDGGFGHEATLRNLEFRGPAPAGAILVDGPVDVILVDTHVRDAGDAFLPSGGGIRSQARGLIALRGDVEVTGNRAEFGAGLACEDGWLDILSSAALISGNVARIAGGGVALTRCTLSWSPDTLSAEAGILGNRALLGGGLYLRKFHHDGIGCPALGAAADHRQHRRVLRRRHRDGGRQFHRAARPRRVVELCRGRYDAG